MKQHKSNRDGRGAFYAILSRWLGQNHVNDKASEAEMVLQMLTYDGDKRTWNWEMYEAHLVSTISLFEILRNMGIKTLIQG